MLDKISVPKTNNKVRNLIVLIIVFCFLGLFLWIRYGAIFSDDGIFDKDYHQQIITNTNAPFGFWNEWSLEKPYICRFIGKNFSNPENPFQHCSLRLYLTEWILDPSMMKSEKANK